MYSLYTEVYQQGLCIATCIEGLCPSFANPNTILAPMLKQLRLSYVLLWSRVTSGSIFYCKCSASTPSLLLWRMFFIILDISGWFNLLLVISRSEGCETRLRNLIARGIPDTHRGVQHDFLQVYTTDKLTLARFIHIQIIFQISRLRWYTASAWAANPPVRLSPLETVGRCIKATGIRHTAVDTVRYDVEVFCRKGQVLKLSSLLVVLRLAFALSHRSGQNG